MIRIINLIMLGIAIVCAIALAFIILDFVTDKVMSKLLKKRNRIHFYVARDNSRRLWLYLSKPKRGSVGFIQSIHGRIIAMEGDFSKYGLDENDYVNLKWEDEPLEVFLNIED